jgi:hypothetical protein
MNERIKELADQAKVLDYSIWDSYNQKTIDHYKFDKEKFAELIVKECIDVVKPTQHHEVWAQSYLGGVDGLDLLHSKIKHIKEHFGVKP